MKRLLGVILLVGSWGVHAGSRAPLFVSAPGSPVTVGPGSGQVVLADLDGDGHVDLIAKHLLARKLSVRLGDGRGRFRPAAADPMPLGYEPGAMALGDVNHDRIPDLGVAWRDREREYVQLLLGTGTGAFAQAPGPPLVVAAAQQTYKPTLQFIDINKDGKLDLVTANGRRNRIEILLGNGRGGFAATPGVRLEPDRDRYSFALGDVDGDGRLDVVSASSVESGGPGHLAVLRGDGKGAFEAAPRPLTVPPDSRVLTLARINEDRRLDVVLSHAKQLTVLSNQGQGTFRASGPPIDVERPAMAVVAADVNRDGRLDLVAATERSLTVLLAEPRGFVPAAGSPYRAGPGAYNLAVGDVDEDGRLDIAGSSFEGDALTLLLGR